MELAVAIVHYHLQTGGVTRVLQHAVQALAARGMRPALLTGSPPEHSWPCPVQVLPALQYEEARPPVSPRELAHALHEAAREALGRAPDLWHVHNHSLGKNLVLPVSLRLLAESGERMLLQVHDLAEDGRPALYRRMLDSLGEGQPTRLAEVLYPDAPQVHYAVLNRREYQAFRAAGLADDRIHLLPNAVDLDMEADAAPTERPDAGPPLWLYPTRAIRRKNLGEFLLWAAVMPRARFATTRGPTNPAERPRYQAWRRFAETLRLPVEFELGERPGAGLMGLLAACHGTVTTSIAEGFGLAFLEPWLAQRPVAGRDLPDLTNDFRAEGVRLAGLYRRLEFPADWLDPQAVRQAAARALQRIHEAYRRTPPPEAVERALAAWIQAGYLDFGRLDEPLQQQVIRRLRASAADRSALRPSGLDARLPDAETIGANRQRIRRHFGLNTYGERLLASYRPLLDAPTASPESLDGEALLDHYLSPERLYLLRA